MVLVGTGAVVLLNSSSGGPGSGNATAPMAAPVPPPTNPAPPPPAVTPGCPIVPTAAVPERARPRYLLDAEVRLSENLVVGTVDVRFTPDLATDRLVLRLWPNSPRLTDAGAELAAGPVMVDGRPAISSLEDPTTLIVRPDGGLAANREIRASLEWSLRLPGVVDRLSRDGDTVRLGSFFPILAWEPGVGWATEPPTQAFAEASTSPTADFDLTLKVPPGLTVLASGTSDREGHWTVTAVRDVAVSIGRMTLATAVVHAPEPVRVTVGVEEGLAEAPEAYLEEATRVLEDFAGRFGPYPWPALSLAVSSGLEGRGIEYPTHIMLGTNTLGEGIVAHEVAHQWFYSLVGNNQGRDPWLDEGLATYAERRATDTLDELLSFAMPPGVQGRVGESMAFWGGYRSEYVAGVYRQGAQAIASLGDPDLVDCALRVYVAVNAYRIPQPRDFVIAARSVFPDADASLDRFGVKADR